MKTLSIKIYKISYIYWNNNKYKKKNLHNLFTFN